MLFLLTVLLHACVHGARPVPERALEAPSAAVDATGDMLVEDVGIETLGGVFTPILAAGCRLPCVATESFSTAADGQTELAIHVYRGAGVKLVTEAHRVADVAVVGIPSAPRGAPEVRVTFRADARGLHLSATDATSGDALAIEPR